MQATLIHVTGTRNSNPFMDQACYWHLPLWGSVILVTGGLHKPVSNCMQAQFHDITTCDKSLQINIFRILVARYPYIEQWVLLYSRSVHQSHARLQCELHYKLPTLPQLNGLTEEFVQTVLNLFYKAKHEETDIFKSLMIYCNTPITSNLQSPM